MKILQTPTEQPRWTLTIVFLLTLLMAFGISKMKVRNSFDGELPATDPIVMGLDSLKAVFEERSTLLIGIETDNVFNRTTLQKVADLSERLQDIPFVLPDEITSLSTLNNVKTRDWGLDVGVFMKEVPRDAEALEQLKRDVLANDLVLGNFVSVDETMTVIAANLEEGFDGGTVYDAVSNLVAEFAGPERIYLSGAPLMVEDVQRGISGDSRSFIPIALLIIFLGFFVCFRTARGTLLPILVVILSIVWTMGFMGYMNLPTTVVSNALPVVMVAVASSYGIHFMFAYYEMANQLQDRTKIIQSTLDKVGGPILITGVTSAAGSISLMIFKIISLREFGIIGAAGFCFATFICLTVLPALSMLLPVSKGRLWQGGWLSRFLQGLTDWSINNRRIILPIVLGLIPVWIYFIGQIRIGDNYQHFFPGSHSGRIALETFDAKLNGMRVMDLMIDGGESDRLKDPSFYQGLQKFQQYIETLPMVGSTHAYTNIVNHVYESMLPGEQSTLDAHQISQFLAMYEMSADPGDVFSLRDENYQTARLQIFLKTSEPAEHERIFLDLEDRFAQFFPSQNSRLTFGGEVMYRIALGRYIVRGKVQNIILALLAVLLICSLLFRSLKKGLQTVLPITFSLLTVFGLMGVFGIRLGISTSLLTGMIVGIGVDFAVHYLMRYYAGFQQSKDAVNAIQNTATTTGKAIFFDAASNAIGFTALLFSGFLPVQHFGSLLTLSMLLIFLVTIVVYPVLFSMDWKARMQSSELTNREELSVLE